jgi:hypothetical protein
METMFRPKASASVSFLFSDELEVRGLQLGHVHAIERDRGSRAATQRIAATRQDLPPGRFLPGSMVRRRMAK